MDLPDEPLVSVRASVPAPVADVWRAWTSDAGLRSWAVKDSHIELRVGGAYEWYFLGEDAPDGRGSEGCVVIGFQAPTMLTFTWNAPPHLDQARAQRTVVLLRLHPSHDDTTTEVVLTELGWGRGGQWDQAYDYFAAAWPRVLDGLVRHFTGEAEAASPEPPGPTG